MYSVYPVDFTEWQDSQPRIHKAQKDMNATEQIQITADLKQSQMGESKVYFHQICFTF